MDGPSRRSVSTSRRSLSRNRLDEKRPPEKQGSSDSYVHSLEEPGSSGAMPSTSDQTQASASQILRGSLMFSYRQPFSARHQQQVAEIQIVPLTTETRSDSPSRNTVNRWQYAPQFPSCRNNRITRRFKCRSSEPSICTNSAESRESRIISATTSCRALLGTSTDTQSG
jgi:sterol 3beta-glucosyltransferase